MSLSLPVSRSVEITSAQSYVLTLEICGTASTATFQAKATPLSSQRFYGPAWEYSVDQETSVVTILPGQRLRQITGTRDGFFIFADVPDVPLVCDKQSTSVSVFFPMGLTYQRPGISPGEFAAGASPSQYRYSVTSSNKAIAEGSVRIAMRPNTTSGGDLKICKANVRVV